MTPDSFVEARVGDVERSEVGNGIVVHRLYRSGPEADARRALLVAFPPGAQWPGEDVHDPGPEDVYVVRGTFRGLTGDSSVHGPGTFLHLAAGTRHSPSTATGGELFVHYPEG
jgi:quercetin dioxygenase-like cupin family protein